MSPRAIGCWKLSLGMLIVPSPLVGAVPSLAMATSTYMPSGRASAFTPLIVSSGESSGDKATTKITMVTRMVLTVFVTTPGPAVPELTISGVKAEARPDGMYVLVAIANDGTAPTSGEGTISMPSESFQQPIALGDMVPMASTGYPIKWK